MAKAPKVKRSDRYFIDAQGEEVEKIELATGGGYQLVNPDKSEVQAFEEQFGPAGDFVTMHAIFGFFTINGNEANTVLNTKKGTMLEAAAAIAEHIENAKKGIWREAGDGAARGPKYDKDILAGALLAYLTAEAAKPGWDGAKIGDLPFYRTKLDDQKYGAQVRSNTDVMAQYYKDLTAKGGAAPKSNAAGLA